MQRTIYTIGHSTRTFEEFLVMLRSFEIEKVADVRSYPGSRKYPQFNKETLAVTLPEHGIKYAHIRELGGRRKVDKDSQNTVWRHPAFRGYADYMKTPQFEAGVKELERMAIANKVAFMCSEAVWWRCHRSMVADYLKVEGWLVLHIMAAGKAEEHPFTSPAKEINGKLVYGSE